MYCQYIMNTGREVKLSSRRRSTSKEAVYWAKNGQLIVETLQGVSGDAQLI